MAFSVSSKVHFVHGRLKHPIGQFTAAAASSDGASARSAAPTRSAVPSPMKSRLVRSMRPPPETPGGVGQRATARVYCRPLQALRPGGGTLRLHAAGAIGLSRLGQSAVGASAGFVPGERHARTWYVAGVVPAFRIPCGSVPVKKMTDPGPAGCHAFL